MHSCRGKPDLESHYFWVDISAIKPADTLPFKYHSNDIWHISVYKGFHKNAKN